MKRGAVLARTLFPTELPKVFRSYAKRAGENNQEVREYFGFSPYPQP